MRTTRGTNPEREAVKEYLQQYHDAKAKKQILEERHRTLSADLRDPGVGSAYRTMPTSKRQAREGGAVSLVYDRHKGNGDVPDENTIELRGERVLLKADYQTYDTLTGTTVYQGTLLRQPIGIETFAVISNCLLTLQDE